MRGPIKHAHTSVKIYMPFLKNFSYIISKHTFTNKSEQNHIKMYLVYYFLVVTFIQGRSKQNFCYGQSTKFAPLPLYLA